MARSTARAKTLSRACPPPPPPPVAGGAAGYWWSGPGKDWRPLPALAPEKEDKQVTLPSGPVEHIDPAGQQWRSGQRLIR